MKGGVGGGGRVSKHHHPQESGMEEEAAGWGADYPQIAPSKYRPKPLLLQVCTPSGTFVKRADTCIGITFQAGVATADARMRQEKKRKTPQVLHFGGCLHRLPITQNTANLVQLEPVTVCAPLDCCFIFFI